MNYRHPGFSHRSRMQSESLATAGSRHPPHRRSRPGSPCPPAGLFAVLLLLASGPALASAETGQRTLDRLRDPLIVEGSEFAGLFDAEAPQDLSLYAYGPGGFRAIPCQFDFIGEDKLVIPRQVNRVRQKAVYDFIPNPDYPERLAGRYQFLFMARDAGDLFPGPELPADFSKGVEIEIRDPVTGGVGWAYLMKPGTAPAPLKDDYVDYTLIKKGQQNTEQIQAVGYVTGFPDANKPFAYGYWVIPRGAGGSGENLLQTLRVRVHIKILGLTLELDPKTNIIPYVLGYNDGPVRVTRRVFSSVVFKGIKMDWLMGGDAKLETESHYYGDYFFFDGEVSLPGFVKKVSKIKAMFTTDFSKNASGLTWFNSENAADPGCVADGKMSPQEQALAQAPYGWSLLTGEQGGWANILQMHTASVRPNMKLFYLDDSAYRYEKDPDIDGTWASTGYYLDKLDKAEEKVTFRTNIFAIPNTFSVSDIPQLTRLVDNPLQPAVKRFWGHKPDERN